MARKIENAPGITADSDYPKGYKIENGKTGVGEHINQDIVQFFQKLLKLAGITVNGNYDNEVNGYQLLDAIKNLFYTKTKANDNTQNDIDASTLRGSDGYTKAEADSSFNNSIDASTLVGYNFQPFISTIQDSADAKIIYTAIGNDTDGFQVTVYAIIQQETALITSTNDISSRLRPSAPAGNSKTEDGGRASIQVNVDGTVTYANPFNYKDIILSVTYHTNLQL